MALPSPPPNPNPSCMCTSPSSSSSLLTGRCLHLRSKADTPHLSKDCSLSEPSPRFESSFSPPDHSQWSSNRTEYLPWVRRPPPFPHRPSAPTSFLPFPEELLTSSISTSSLPILFFFPHAYKEYLMTGKFSHQNVKWKNGRIWSCILSDSDYLYIKNEGKTAFLTVIIPECWVEMIFVCFRMLFSFPMSYSEHNLEFIIQKIYIIQKMRNVPLAKSQLCFCRRRIYVFLHCLIVMAFPLWNCLLAIQGDNFCCIVRCMFFPLYHLAFFSYQEYICT